jgi:hypothetical protein
MDTLTMNSFFDQVALECRLDKNVLVDTWVSKNYLARLVTAYENHNLDSNHDWLESRLFPTLYVGYPELIWFSHELGCEKSKMMQIWRGKSAKPAHPAAGF